jgi:hypothetical protein
VTTPYYQDEWVTLYLGDCREVDAWRSADVLVTDPPYGRGWRQGHGLTNADGQGIGSKEHAGIVGDKDTSARDDVLAAWGDRLAIVFGDLLIAPPAGAVQALIYGKPLDAGIKGARAGFRRDVEAIYLVGKWPAGVGGRTSILQTAGLVAGPRGIGTRAGHPHAKPIDVMEELLGACPPGVIADPFTGSGSTLLAARNVGRKVVGVEIDERSAEQAAKRLNQVALDFGAAS